MSGGSSHSPRFAGAATPCHECGATESELRLGYGHLETCKTGKRAELLRLAGLLASPGAFPKGTREVAFSSRDREVLTGAIPGELDALLGFRVSASENIPSGFAVALGPGRQFVGILDLRGRAPAAEEKLSPLSPQLSTPRKLREP